MFFKTYLNHSERLHYKKVVFNYLEASFNFLLITSIDKLIKQINNVGMMLFTQLVKTTKLMIVFKYKLFI